MKKTTKMVAVLAAMSVMVLGAATMVSADEVQGWKQENNSWYYYVDGDRVANQWALSGKDWYYLGDNGKMVTDEFVGNIHAWDIVEYDVIDAYDEEYYYLDSAGKMAKGWVKIDSVKIAPYRADLTNWYYFDESTGKMLGDAWVKGATAWYHVGRSGQMQKNTLLTDREDDKTYILDKNGAMVTGWYKTAAKLGLIEQDFHDEELFENVVAKDVWTWADASGVAKEFGWEKINGKWYFFGSESVDKDGNPTLAEDMDGKPLDVANFTMANNMQFVDNAEDAGTFRLLDSGAMVTGWYREDRYSDWEYYESNGIQVVNKLKNVSGRFYLFNEAGVMEEEGQIAVANGAKKESDRVYDDYTLTSGGTNAFTDMRRNVTSGWVVYELGTTRTGKSLLK